MLSDEALEKLQEMVNNIEIPQAREIWKKMRSKHPFQGNPFDAVYARDIPKKWKGLTIKERMLAWGWINPAAEDYTKMSPEEQREFLDTYPTPELRGWTYPRFDPVHTIQELILRFWLDTGKVPKNTYELLAYANYENTIAKSDITKPPEWLFNFISPVTGRLMRFSEETFSPGNMFVLLISKDELSKYDKHWKVHLTDGDVVPVSEAYKVLFYYHVYGEKGIIRSGYFGVTKDGALSFN